MSGVRDVEGREAARLSTGARVWDVEPGAVSRHGHHLGQSTGCYCVEVERFWQGLWGRSRAPKSSRGRDGAGRQGVVSPLEQRDMLTLKPEHEVALRCLHWLPADVRPTAELLAELMCVPDHKATQMLAELRSARLLASARARGIPCAALECRGPRHAPIGTGKVAARARRP